MIKLTVFRRPKKIARARFNLRYHVIHSFCTELTIDIQSLMFLSDQVLLKAAEPSSLSEIRRCLNDKRPPSSPGPGARLTRARGACLGFILGLASRALYILHFTFYILPRDTLAHLADNCLHSIFIPRSRVWSNIPGATEK